jgi:hypothetical protein
MKTLEDIDMGNDFLNMTQITQKIKERIDKWNYIKLKSFCTSEDLSSKVKRQESLLPFPAWGTENLFLSLSLFSPCPPSYCSHTRDNPLSLY